ncbi:MAG: PA14 domain-containing protein [Rubrivivax sp.]
MTSWTSHQPTGRARQAVLAALAGLVGCGADAPPTPTRPSDAGPAATATAAAPAPAMASGAMDSELARAAERGNMCSGREAKAAGLMAEYFAEPAFGGRPVVARLEGPVEEARPADMGTPGVANIRSVRWRGWIRPPLSGAYSFHANQSGVTITVAGQRLGESADGATGPHETVLLAAGRYHPITVEWAAISAPRGDGKPATLSLSWTAPHGARYVVPKTALYPPSDTVTDAVRPAATLTLPAPR